MKFARKNAWDLHKNMFKGKHVRSSSDHQAEKLRRRVVASRSDCHNEGREFIIDSGASLHMLSKDALTPGDRETMIKSGDLTVIVTATRNRRVDDDAAVYINDLDVLGTMMLLKDSPAALSLRSLCEEMGHSYGWKMESLFFPLTENGKVRGANLRTMHVTISVGSKEPRIPDVPTKASGESQVPKHQSGSDTFFNPMPQARRTQATHPATDCISQVSRYRESGRMERFQNG